MSIYKTNSQEDKSNFKLRKSRIWPLNVWLIRGCPAVMLLVNFWPHHALLRAVRSSRQRGLQRPVSLNWCQSRLPLISAVILFPQSVPSIYFSCALPTVRPAFPPFDTRRAPPLLEGVDKVSEYGDALSSRPWLCTELRRAAEGDALQLFTPC